MNAESLSVVKGCPSYLPWVHDTQAKPVPLTVILSETLPFKSRMEEGNVAAVKSSHTVNPLLPK